MNVRAGADSGRVGTATGVDQPETGILLVDERPMTRRALRVVLDAEPDLVVTGEASTAARAVLLAGQDRPDVVVVGAHDGDDVVEVVREIVRTSPASRVLVMRPADTASDVSAMIEAGACGYLLSKVTAEELLAAIRGVSTDQERVVLSVSRRSLPSLEPATDGVLSNREIAVLELVAQALTNAQIARRLEITEATVKRHLQNIYGKLGAGCRLEAVNRASSTGLIEAPAPR